MSSDEEFQYEDEADDAYDAADYGEPHVGPDDEAILFAEQLQHLADAGFSPDPDDLDGSKLGGE